MCFLIHLEAEVTTMSADALYVCCHARVHMQGRAMLGLKSHGNRTCSAEFGIGIYSDDASLAAQCAGVRRDTWYAKKVLRSQGRQRKSSTQASCSNAQVYLLNFTTAAGRGT